ncbi:Oxo-4-hydroxy-4-carboxy-5-ureidoimidazoline decarboxylase [Annulohypoxylon maeteangense]|uniref:Oxo-4-hydroxy-4-carboxy-5-ureidoimidazoline decarboxylase n=1 Tax=Annulohypoxylon maeteangense TaxID=1927788 RepID=UPI0020074E08|nr:Oxo-4-hydroxy-4-carboxy-5-ureidoimidazoline decarboxylase [Annulohypoxylon maeteangense]KAI0887637.1 Oxo-4-hydroxy-4-carboxy-5-ureidoimidazoline decarboxylase [Annulohypoxylon maeteangense]
MASPTILPPISSLTTADEETIKFALDILFEPSTDLHDLAIPPIRDSPSFTSYVSLIKHVGAIMSQLAQSSSLDTRKRLHGILGSHPRLGEKKVESAQSRAEQAHLNTNNSKEKEEEATKLKALNDEYESKFPGLRYVVFVNGRSRVVVMQNMRERIDRADIRAEELEAIQAMVDIALDRANKLQGTI